MMPGRFVQQWKGVLKCVDDMVVVGVRCNEMCFFEIGVGLWSGTTCMDLCMCVLCVCMGDGMFGVGLFEILQIMK